MPDDPEIVDDPEVNDEATEDNLGDEVTGVEEIEEVEEEKEEVDEEEIAAKSEESEEEKEEEKEDEDEEDEKLPSKYHRPVFSEIKAKYPEFFKDFPDMREVYFREGQYSTIFPTVEDAEEALAKSSNFDMLAQDLVNGSTKTLFDELEKAGVEKVIQVAEDFLPQIQKKSPDLYYHIITPILEKFIKSAYMQGEERGDENLQNAALHLANFGWKHTDISKFAVDKSDPELENKKKAIDDKQKKIDDDRYRDAFSDVATRANKYLLNEIVKEVIDIEDKYKKDHAIKDIFSKVNEVLAKDERHIKLMNSLWLSSKKQSFSTESKRRLVSTLLARAKTILPAISREIMAQINPSKKTDKKVDKKLTVQKKTDAGGKVQESKADSSNHANKGKVDWSKYSSEADFLTKFSENKGRVSRMQ